MNQQLFIKFIRLFCHKTIVLRIWYHLIMTAVIAVYISKVKDVNHLRI